MSIKQVLFQCKDCRYFVQHYVEWNIVGYVEAGCGHCVCPDLKTKTKRPTANACDHWTRRREWHLGE